MFDSICGNKQIIFGNFRFLRLIVAVALLLGWKNRLWEDNFNVKLLMIALPIGKSEQFNLHSGGKMPTKPMHLNYIRAYNEIN